MDATVPCRYRGGRCRDTRSCQLPASGTRQRALPLLAARRSSLSYAVSVSSTAHWDSVWQSRRAEDVSWHQQDPELSHRLIRQVSTPSSSVIDVGGGASRLVDRLLRDDYRDVTVIDIASAALEQARVRLAAQATAITWVTGDVTDHIFGRTFDVWHDRAVFHFMTEETQRARYLDTMRRSLARGAYAVIATFAPDGPESCSGLPVHRYGEADLTAVLGDTFEPVSHHREIHLTPTGAPQPFVYGLFRRQ
jgi:SAM-dependent methyltransferase